MQHLDGSADDARSDSGCSGKTESSSVFSEESHSEENSVGITTQTNVPTTGTVSESAKRSAAHIDLKEENVRSWKRLQLCRRAEELGARTEEIEQALEDEQDSKAALVALVLAKMRLSRLGGDSERDDSLPHRIPEENVAKSEQQDKDIVEEKNEEPKEEFKEENKSEAEEPKEEPKEQKENESPTKEAKSSQSSSDSDSSEGDAEKDVSKSSGSNNSDSESKKDDSESKQSSPEDSDEDAESKAGSEHVQVESGLASISPPSKEDKASKKDNKAGQVVMPPRKRLRIGTKVVDGLEPSKECQDRKESRSEPLKISKQALESPTLSEKLAKPMKLKIRQTSSRRKAPEAVESPKDLAGEWFYNKGREKYELLVDDDGHIIFKQESFSAEGPLQLHGGWWEGDIKIGIIRLQPDAEGNIVSQFKKSHKREWGTLRIACRKEQITKRQKPDTSDHPESEKLSKKKTKVRPCNESAEKLSMERVGGISDRRKAKHEEPGPQIDENVGEPGGLMISKFRSSRRKQAVITDRVSPEGFDSPRHPGARAVGKRLKDSDESSSEPEVRHRSRPKVDRQKPQNYQLGIHRGKPSAVRTQKENDEEDGDGEAFEYTSVADKKAERNANLKRAFSLFQTWVLSTRSPQHEEKLRRRGMLSTTLDVKLEGVWQYKFEKDVARFETKANHREQGTVVSITAEGRRKFKERHQVLWDSAPLPPQASNAKAFEAESRKEKTLSATKEPEGALAGSIRSQIVESTSPETLPNLTSDAASGIAGSWPGSQTVRSRLKQAVGLLKNAVGLSAGPSVQQLDSDYNSNREVQDVTQQDEELPNSEMMKRATATPLQATLASEVVEASAGKLGAEDDPDVQEDCSDALKSNESKNIVQSPEASPRDLPRPKKKLKRIANSSDEEELNTSTTSKNIHKDASSSSFLQEHAKANEQSALTEDCSMVEQSTAEASLLLPRKTSQPSETPKELEAVVSEVTDGDALPFEASSTSPRETCDEKAHGSVKGSCADRSDADQDRIELGKLLQAEVEKDAVAHRERLAKTLADRASLVDASSSSTQTQTVQASSAQVQISKLPPVPQDAPARTISEAQAKLEQNLPAVEVAKLVRFLASQPMDRSTLIATKIPQTLKAVRKKFSADPEIVNTSATLLHDWRILFRQAA